MQCGLSKTLRREDVNNSSLKISKLLNWHETVISLCLFLGNGTKEWQQIRRGCYMRKHWNKSKNLLRALLVCGMQMSACSLSEFVLFSMLMATYGSLLLLLAGFWLPNQSVCWLCVTLVFLLLCILVQHMIIALILIFWSYVVSGIILPSIFMLTSVCSTAVLFCFSHCSGWYAWRHICQSQRSSARSVWSSCLGAVQWKAISCWFVTENLDFCVFPVYSVLCGAKALG